ncbi:hypothetical protein [Croceiramulus getboli]|nr:hypothetical protein P8624_05595 [Flavobacteriaceae bacterium YJPT1-3]
MKKMLVVGFLLVFFSCANQQEDYTRYEGEFIYVADAAVLKGDTFIYGVALNDKVTELQKMVSGYKRDTYDMVPVIVEGELNAKPIDTEGWDSILTIKKIVAVLHPEDRPIEVNKEVQTLSREAIEQKE